MSEEVGRLAEFAERLQARPERHVAYLGLDAGTIAAEMVEEDEDWTACSAVAERDGELVGWLTGSVDHALGRVWWFGPFLDDGDDHSDDSDDGDDGVGERSWSQRADALYASARGLLDDSITQEEFGPDARFSTLIRWAVARGCHVDPGSAVLTLERLITGPPIPARPTTADDVETVGRLHDELFPGTHTRGCDLVAGNDADHVRLVAERDGVVVGYIAVERQPDGEGYIDFLGVAASARRQGVGLGLIRAGVGALEALGCTRTSLTVRETNTGARALYASLGFREERVILPVRRGFTIS